MKGKQVSKIIKNRIPILFGLILLWGFNPTTTNAQELSGWDLLADVVFNEKYDEESEAYWLIPAFGKTLKAAENKSITLEGYFIPVDLEGKFYVLSKFPFSNCFFCGAAGPETVVELQTEENLGKALKLDARVKFSGTLQLNNTDFNHCNYILKSAKIIAKQ